MLGKDLIRAHEEARLVPPFSKSHPGLTPEQGYEGARALHAHRLSRGWKAVGRKIGFTNRTLWERYGVREPMWGTVYDRTMIFASKDQATVDLKGLMQPRIEPEIAFKLKRVPRSAEELPDCLEWMAHACEIVQCRHPDWKVTIADCTADNGLHGRLVLGTPLAPKDLERLPQVEARLFKGDRLVDQGTGANVLGGPLTSLRYLVELLAKQPESPPLAAGEIITTGTLTDAHPVAAGDIWRTEVAGFRGLTISFR